MAITNFVWDDLSDNVLMETDENNVPIVKYTSDPCQFGEVLSQHRHGQDQYFHFDGLGSTRNLTDQNEAVCDSYSYTAFGELVARTGSTPNPFQFNGASGYFTNEETGDFYVRRRTCHATLARWLSQDPLGFVDGPNAYLYVNNSVHNLMDPSGAMACAAKCVVDTFLVVQNRFIYLKHPSQNLYRAWNMVTFALTLVDPSTKADCLIKNYLHGTLTEDGTVVINLPKWSPDGPNGDPTWWDSAQWLAGVLYVPVGTIPAGGGEVQNPAAPWFTEVKPRWNTPQDATFFDSPGRTTSWMSSKTFPVVFTFNFKTEVEDKITSQVVASVTDWTAHWTATKMGTTITFTNVQSSHGTPSHP